MSKNFKNCKAKQRTGWWHWRSKGGNNLRTEKNVSLSQRATSKTEQMALFVFMGRLRRCHWREFRAPDPGGDKTCLMENRTVRFQIETDFDFQLKDKEDNQRSLPSKLVTSIGIFKALIHSGDDEGTKKTFSSKQERKKIQRNEEPNAYWLWDPQSHGWTFSLKWIWVCSVSRLLVKVNTHPLWKNVTSIQASKNSQIKFQRAWVHNQKIVQRMRNKTPWANASEDQPSAGADPWEQKAEVLEITCEPKDPPANKRQTETFKTKQTAEKRTSKKIRTSWDDKLSKLG